MTREAHPTESKHSRLLAGAFLLSWALPACEPESADQLRSADSACATDCELTPSGAASCRSSLELDEGRWLGIRVEMDPTTRRVFTATTHYVDGESDPEKCAARLSCGDGSSVSCTSFGGSSESCNNGIGGVGCEVSAGGSTCDSQGACSSCDDPSGCTLFQTCPPSSGI